MTKEWPQPPLLFLYHKIIDESGVIIFARNISKQGNENRFKKKKKFKKNRQQTLIRELFPELSKKKKKKKKKKKGGLTDVVSETNNLEASALFFRPHSFHNSGSLRVVPGSRVHL